MILAVVGVGNGLAIPSLFTAALTDVPSLRAGAGSAMLTTSQQFANSIGVTVLGLLATGTRMSDHAHLLNRLLFLDLALLGVAYSATRLLPRAPARPPRAPAIDSLHVDSDAQAQHATHSVPVTRTKCSDHM